MAGLNSLYHTLSVTALIVSEDRPQQRLAHRTTPAVTPDDLRLSPAAVAAMTHLLAG